MSTKSCLIAEVVHVEVCTRKQNATREHAIVYEKPKRTYDGVFELELFFFPVGGGFVLLGFFCSPDRVSLFA